MATDAMWTAEEELRRDPGFPIFVARSSQIVPADSPRLVIAEFGNSYGPDKTDFREDRWQTLIPEVLEEVCSRRSSDWGCRVEWLGAHLKHQHYELSAVLAVDLPAEAELPEAKRIRLNIPEEFWIRFRDVGAKSAHAETRHWIQHAVDHDDPGEQHKGVHKILSVSGRSKIVEALCPSTGYRRLLDLLTVSDPSVWYQAVVTLRDGYEGQSPRARRRWQLAEELSANIKDTSELMDAVENAMRRHPAR